MSRRELVATKELTNNERENTMTNELPEANIPLWLVECVWTSASDGEQEAREQVIASDTLSAVVEWAEKHLRSQYEHVATTTGVGRGVTMTVFQHRPMVLTKDRNETVWAKSARSRTLWSTEHRWNENALALETFG